LSHSPTNQIFPVFPINVLEKLRRDFVIPDWEKIDGGHTQVRLVTSWRRQKSRRRRFLKRCQSLGKFSEPYRKE
jgi:threonine aldolase